MEPKYPTYLSMGNDVDESRLALENVLLAKLGTPEAVSGWMQSSNELLEGKSPEVVLHVQPDKVVIAAFHARKTRTE